MKFIFVYSTDDTLPVSYSFDTLVADLEEIDTRVDSARLFVSETDSRNLFNDGEVLGVLQGYVRYLDLDRSDDVRSHNRSLFDDLTAGRFPLGGATCASFGAFGIDRRSGQAVLANDVIGFYPVYYYRNKSTLIVSSHLLLFSGVLNCEIDHTGVAQRLTGPEYCNFGSRTILHDVFRLLPGEYIKLDLSDLEKEVRQYDDSLYRGDFGSSLAEAAADVWTVIKEESEACFRYDKEITIGLSGGMDSRILLASLPEEKKITCHTYGSDKYYETKIAKRCAEVRGTVFHSHPEDTALFPSRELLREYVRDTEAVGINQWLSILESPAVRSGERTPIAIGESTEAIAGRNIKMYSSREARIKAFLGIKKVNWTPLTLEKFESWKRAKTKWVLDRLTTAERPFEAEREKIIADTERDLESLYRRIAAHDMKFVELLDELFAWYTHARIPISNQLLLLRARFSPVCPTMSARCLRAISAVHPSFRLNATLMDEIFRLPDLKCFSPIPTAQIPFIGYGFNEKVKLFVWGLRSKTDQLLMKIAALRKKADARNRVLKSTNWALAYHRADPEIVRSWFTPDHVGGKTFLRTFEGRAKQEIHPLIPFDIVSAAGVNMEIDLISSNRSPRGKTQTWGS